MPLDTKDCMPLLEHEFDMKVLKQFQENQQNSIKYTPYSFAHVQVSMVYVYHTKGVKDCLLACLLVLIKHSLYINTSGSQG